MKIHHILPALLATAVASHAATITVGGAANSTTAGAATFGSVLTTTLIADNSTSPQNMVITVSALNIDGSGGDNDSVTLTFTATTDGQNIQTSGTAAAGWLSSGGTTLNADGEFVQMSFTSMSVDLNGGTGNGNGISGESFTGFTALDLGSWGAGHLAYVVLDSGTVQVDQASNASGDVTFAASQSVRTTFDTSQTTPSAGSYRPTNYDFDFEVNLVPEPSTALLGAFGLLALLRRRRS